MQPSGASAWFFEYRESLARRHISDKRCHSYEAISGDEEVYLEEHRAYARSLGPLVMARKCHCIFSHLFRSRKARCPC